MIRKLFIDFRNIWKEEREFAKKTIQENKIFNDTTIMREDKKKFSLSKLNSYNLICKTLPNFFDNILKETNNNYNITGSIGKGQLATIPWISILDKEITTSCQNGYYIIYLFDYELKKLYLCLNLGWTQYSRIYRFAEARKRILENSYLLKKILTSDIETNKINLLTNNTMAKYYEDGNIINIDYDLNNLPDDSILKKDLLTFINYYKELKKLIGREFIFLDSKLDENEYKDSIHKINIKHYDEINESLKVDTRKKIAFIWTSKYRNFDNLSFNLSSKYKFEFINNVINIVSKNERLNGFFGNTISDALAIIGQNSSGKTSLLELINKLINKHKNEIDSDFLLIMETNNNLECFYSFKIGQPFTNENIIVKNYNEYKQSDIRTLMFSNIEDSNYRFLEKNKNGQVLNSSIIKHSIERDFKNNMQLIGAKFFQLLKINVPKKVSIFYTEKDFFRKIISWRKDINDYHIIIILLQYELIKKHYKKNSIEIKSLSSLRNIFNELKHQNYDNDDLKKKIQFIEDIKDNIFDKLDVSPISILKKGGIYFSINYNREFLIKLLELIDDSNYFSFKWIGISSGEKAYLNMFSYIYNELKNIKTSNIILCIDEGDLFLHPEWQVEFFNKLVTCIPHFYNYNIQIILTSHSPMILSDFPNENVAILKNVNNEYTKFYVMEGIKLNTKTFGGNIYALYRDAFFLGGKKTSDFAAKKINELIKSAEKEDNHEELIDKINMIGSDVIKYKILDIIQSNNHD